MWRCDPNSGPLSSGMPFVSEPGREWRLYLDDMIGFAERAPSYTAGLDRDGFVADRLRYDATLRNLELLGEAAGRVPAAVQRRRAGDTVAPARRRPQPSCACLSRDRRRCHLEHRSRTISNRCSRAFEVVQVRLRYASRLGARTCGDDEGLVRSSRGLKIPVSAVRFCPRPPYLSGTWPLSASLSSRPCVSLAGVDRHSIDVRLSSRKRRSWRDVPSAYGQSSRLRKPRSNREGADVTEP